MNYFQFGIISFGGAMTSLCAVPLILKTIFTYGWTMRCLLELTNEFQQLIGMWFLITVLWFTFRDKKEKSEENLAEE